MFSFNVISSNIRFDNPADGAHSWKARREILASTLNNFLPDVVGTQEGWEPQLRDLESRLKGLAIIDENREWIDDRMYPTLYFNPLKFQLINSGDIWLSETPYIAATKSFGSAFPRLCTWAVLKENTGGREFFFVNAHLDHLESSTRKEQIKVLINEVSKVRGNLPIVMTGDFNESPFESVRKEIEESDLNLVDPWITLAREEVESHHSFKGQDKNGSRIDWILISDDLNCSDIQLFQKSIDGIFPSDHFPVFATISAR